jgi:TatA/E family protein of Tat protein translocase
MPWGTLVFGSLGFTEIAFVLILALLLFGPKRLPEIGRTIGKGLSEFRRASNDLKRSFESEISIEEPPARRPAPVNPMQSLPAPVVAQMNAGPATTPAAGAVPVEATSAAEEATEPAAPAPGGDAPSDPSSTA